MVPQQGVCRTASVVRGDLAAAQHAADVSKRREADRALIEAMRRLVDKRPRFGCEHPMLNAMGWSVGLGSV